MALMVAAVSPQNRAYSRSEVIHRAGDESIFPAFERERPRIVNNFGPTISTIEERMGEANQSNIGSWLERKERSPQLMVAAASLAPNIVLVLVIGRSAVAG